jgi:hypothetical protein
VVVWEPMPILGKPKFHGSFPLKTQLNKVEKAWQHVLKWVRIIKYYE